MANGANIVKKDQAVSRQLTGAELGVEQELDSLSKSRPSAPSHLGNIGPYDVMSDENKARRARIDELQAMQSMSYLASARRELHDRSIKDEADEKEIASAIEDFSNEMKDPTKTQQTAYSNVMKKNPNLAMNPYLPRLNQLSDSFETNDQRKVAAAKATIDKNKLSLEEMQSSAIADFHANNPEFLKEMTALQQTGAIDASKNEALEANLNRMRLEATKKIMETMDSAPTNKDDPNFISGVLSMSGYIRNADGSPIDTIGFSKFISKNPSQRGEMINSFIDPAFLKIAETAIGKDDFYKFVTGKNAKGEAASDEEIDSIGKRIYGMSYGFSAKRNDEAAARKGTTQSSSTKPRVDFDFLDLAKSTSDDIVKARTSFKTSSQNDVFEKSRVYAGILEGMATSARADAFKQIGSLPSSNDALKKKIKSNADGFADIVKKAVDEGWDAVKLAEALKEKLMDGLSPKDVSRLSGAESENGDIPESQSRRGPDAPPSRSKK